VRGRGGVRATVLGLVALIVAACGQPNAAPAAEEAKPIAAPSAKGAAFDYYVLALSWSPAYCADRESDGARDSLQCDGRRPFAFVVHGLWPQNARGYPADCPTEVRTVPDAVTNAMLDVMPSRGLVQHQWRKHGTCTGLAPKPYFDLARALFARVVIPLAYRGLSRPLRVTGAEVEQAFLNSNPSVSAAGVAVLCRGGRLREVRVCFSLEGAPRACGPDVTDQCARGPVTMLPVRGG
jgi:ribonuclease T2